MLGEKQFISLLEKLDEGVIITSSEYDIMYANEIATAYFGEKIFGKFLEFISLNVLAASDG